jgi:5-methylthioribose kinase
MLEITPETATDYLRAAGRVPDRCAVSVRALGWGVSNIVMRVEIEGRPPIVLKQSRERLRTQAHWVSRLDRIWTERAALELLSTILPPGAVPAVLFADEPNYLIAMTCAPDDSVVWKEQLLAGQADPAVAHQAGELLGLAHAQTVGHPALAGRLSDTVVFDQLRVDPYYRTIARVHPDLAPRIDALITSMSTAPDRTFVHADFSPKNILVHSRGLTLVDFETAHTGDPAFDLGFFLSHLILKAFRAAPDSDRYLDLTRAFWDSYQAQTGIDVRGDRVRRAIAHATACVLARIDGKSPVEYLAQRTQISARQFARSALVAELPDWDRFIKLAAQEMRDNPGQERDDGR